MSCRERKRKRAWSNFERLALRRQSCIVVEVVTDEGCGMFFESRVGHAQGGFLTGE